MTVTLHIIYNYVLHKLFALIINVFISLGMGKTMRETMVQIHNNLNRASEDDLVVGEQVFHAVLGNFVKMMILYDDGDKDILKYFGSSFSVIYRLIKYVDWDSCLVDAQGANKISICGALDIEAPMFEEHIRGYMKLDLMTRVARGVYMLNPSKLYMGEGENQKKLMIDYELRKMKDEK